MPGLSNYLCGMILFSGGKSDDNQVIMPTVHFTSHLQAFVNSEPVEVAAETVGGALQDAFEGKEQLRSYVMDEHGRLRRHIMLFIDGKMVEDRVNLTDPITETSEVYVMQALSGG